MNSTVTLPRVAVLALALFIGACSNTPSTPSSPATPPPGGTAPSTPQTCSFTVSATTLTLGATGGISTINVTAGSGCAWTATSSASFITIASGANGSGNGSVALNVAQAPGSNRSGTVTIAGQTVTVNQTGAGIIVAFDMYDSGSQAGPVTSCRVRGAPGYPISNCPLLTTSRTTLSNTLVNWSWTITYTYDGQNKTQTQNTGAIQDFQFYEYCGKAGSSASGTVIPMTVSLTVTDSNGVQATATSGQGNQPALTFVAYTCS